MTRSDGAHVFKLNCMHVLLLARACDRIIVAAQLRALKY